MFSNKLCHLYLDADSLIHSAASHVVRVVNDSFSVGAKHHLGDHHVSAAIALTWDSLRDFDDCRRLCVLVVMANVGTLLGDCRSGGHDYLLVFAASEDYESDSDFFACELEEIDFASSDDCASKVSAIWTFLAHFLKKNASPDTE